MWVLPGHRAGARPSARWGGTGNALYWISRRAGKGGTGLELFWAGQRPKGTAHAGTWHGPARPTSSQLLPVNFPGLPSAHTFPLLCSMLYETALAPWPQPCTETWVQKPRWEHSIPTACVTRDPSQAASPKFGLNPGKPVKQKAALSGGGLG